MLDVYYWTTPNGHKVTILLEELAIPYHLIPVDIGSGAQFEAGFLAISPNNRIPALVDHDPADGKGPISIFESGAILLYLADKAQQFIPQELRGRNQVLQWLFWQMGGFGPMLGQNHHFGFYAKEKIPYAIDRYVNETARLYGVLNKQLKNRSYICGDYSIADMACYPWTVSHERQQQDLDDFPHLKRWHMIMKDRDAVIKAYELPERLNIQSGISDDADKILFGQGKEVVED